VSTDVSEEHIASIFTVEKISSARNQRESRWQACWIWVLFLAGAGIFLFATGGF
jgi:hypothetical protein